MLEETPLKLFLLFIACMLVVGIFSVVVGLITGYMLGILPLVILTTLLTAFVNNRLDSWRIKRELKKEGLE